MFGTSRRRFLSGALGLFASSVVERTPAAGLNPRVEYGATTLAPGIRSRRIDTRSQVGLHFLEAGFETEGLPCIVLLHGFPELAYTWRKQLLPLAGAGFHVVAPDLRGYGLSALQPVAYTDSLIPYSMLNRVADVRDLVHALGRTDVAMVVGHDWGGPTAQWCARLHPDVFKAVVSVSTPFLAAEPPDATSPASGEDIDSQLAALKPPRKHYFTFSASRGANDDLWHAPQGVHNLLRELFYFKSADWSGNKPFPLKSWKAAELAKMPRYYVMDLDKGMARTLAEHQPSPAQIAACTWMREAELAVYAAQFARTGFQGGLNYYRAAGDEALSSQLDECAGRTIDVPACYIGGAQEWAVYQSPGAFQSMHRTCTRLAGVHLVLHAGHSVVEEQSQAVNRLLIEFGSLARTA